MTIPSPSVPRRALGTPAGDTAAPLAGRIPGQAVMSELLARQHGRSPRGTLSRLFGRSPLSADDRPWFWGALGEMVVGQRLRKLEAEWTVLHAVPVGGGSADIDHVVIGPGGAFTVNTKNHSGQRVWVAGRSFLVAGQKQDHVRNSEHEASRAATLLGKAVGRPVHVTPLLVVVRPRALTVGDKPTAVTVLTDAQLVRWLKKRPVVLSPDDVATVAAAANQQGTWRVSGAGDGDPAAVRSAFDAVHKEVRSARRLLRLWTVAVGLGAAAGAVTVGPELTQIALEQLTS